MRVLNSMETPRSSLPHSWISRWYTAEGTACTTTMSTVPILSHTFRRVRVDRAMRMPRGRPTARDTAKLISPIWMEMGAFWAMILAME